MWEELEKKYSVHKGIYARYIKRIIDLVVTTIGFICISPIFLMVCVLVRVKLGSPIFFKQKRVGKNKNYFNILKFRTMRVDTPKNCPTHLLKNPDQYITKVGKFLRKTSLDELPQIFPADFPLAADLHALKPSVFDIG